MILVVKILPANVGNTRVVGSIPGSGRSLGIGNDNLLWYSCLENMDRRAWWATSMGPQSPGVHSNSCPSSW